MSKTKTSTAAWLVLILLLVIPALCCIGGRSKQSSPPAPVTSSETSNTTDPKDLDNPQGRQKIANGFHQMAIESGKSTVFDTEGPDKKTMSVESETMRQADCSALVSSDWSKTMTSVGFTKVVCRNTTSDNQWSYLLP